MTRAAALGFCLATLFGISLAPASAAPELSEMTAVVHVHTSVADGASSPAEIARAARAAGVDALVVTDHFLMSVAYAPWPLGGALGVTLSRPSVVTYGIARYIRTLSDAERAVPGILVVPGLEVTPYARFRGSLLSGDLELDGWHRHLLVIGIEDPAALARLPVLGNRAGGVYGASSLLFLIPAIGLAWSIRRIARPGHSLAHVGACRFRRRRRPVPEALLGGLCLVLLGAGFPFRVERYSPVGRDPGDAVFEEVIDRVRALGGITTWAHPEARAEIEGFHGVRIGTEPYPELVLRTHADGFGALPEGVKALLPAGGIWDQALSASLHGPHPGRPFALAEVDEHRSAAEIDYRLLQTVLLVRARTRAGFMEALAAGRLYGRWTPQGQEPLRLAEFQVEGPAGQALAGQSIVAPGARRIRFVVAGGNGSPVTARLLRGGEVIWTTRGSPPIRADVDDATPAPTYYRLDVEGAYPYRLVSNPVTILAPGDRT